MLWMLIVVAIVGLLLGLRYRAPAMLAASVGVTVAGGALSLTLGHSALRAMISAGLMLATLQVTYLIALGLPGYVRAIMKSRAG